jgi:7-carboxy-7-deazaguanine synthase
MSDSKNNSLIINEIFYSIQGESTYAGRLCVFVRLTYCNLRCTYCDTAYAFTEGREMTLEEIMRRVGSFKCGLVEVTGGEPLLQKNVHTLLTMLGDAGYEVLLETGGHMDIRPVDKRVKRIMDIKCPSSGESEKNRWQNITDLRPQDEVKFVVGDRRDYEWAAKKIAEYQLNEKCSVLISPVFGKINYEELAGWILGDRLPVRMQLQMHKYIWPPDKRGV